MTVVESFIDDYKASKEVAAGAGVEESVAVDAEEEDEKANEADTKEALKKVVAGEDVVKVNFEKGEGSEAGEKVLKRPAKLMRKNLKRLEKESARDIDINQSCECDLTQTEVFTEMVIEEVLVELNLVENEVLGGMLIELQEQNSIDKIEKSEIR